MVQNDIHAPGTTVYEALEFSAQMRVLHLDKHKLKDFVDQVGPHPTNFPGRLSLLAALEPSAETMFACRQLTTSQQNSFRKLRPE